MAKKKPVIVNLTETDHPSQPWKYSIDRPGKGGLETKEERYSNAYGARRAAVKHLGAYAQRQYLPTGKYKLIGYFMQDGRPIEFHKRKLDRSVKSTTKSGKR